MEKEKETLNLTKYLSSSGVASRRQCADLIKSGLVFVNGTAELNPGRRIGPDDSVIFRGCSVKPAEKHYYILLHKPRGYVCTNQDIHAEKKAIDLIHLPDHPRLFSAGRLDKNSEGLILFSNDGSFVEQLTHPRHEVYKTYDVSTGWDLSDRHIDLFLRGIPDGGEVLKAIQVVRLGPCRIRMVLGEGRNREIRRMLESVGNTTRRLKRIAVGRLSLGSLPCGKWRELTKEEIRLALERPVDLENSSAETAYEHRVKKKNILSETSHKDGFTGNFEKTYRQNDGRRHTGTHFVSGMSEKDRRIWSSGRNLEQSVPVQNTFHVRSLQEEKRKSSGKGFSQKSRNHEFASPGRIMKHREQKRHSDGAEN